MARLHGRRNRVLMNGVDLSCYLSECSVELQRPTQQGDAFCNGVSEQVTGIPTASATIQGFYSEESDGLLYTILPNFALDIDAKVVIESTGHVKGGMATAFRGPITQFSRPKAVANIQTISSGVAVSGELYEMVNLLSWGASASVFSNGGGTSIVVDRQTLQAPYNGASHLGGLYLQWRNTTTTSRTITVKTSATDASWGSVTALITSTVAPGDHAVVVTGTAAIPTDVLRYVNITIDSAPASGTIVAPYVSVIDHALSMLNR